MRAESGLRISDASCVTVWRVGRAPDPWAWIDYRYAGGQRWDDASSEFRTICAADSLYACFVEILAHLRPDLEEDGSALLDDIDEDPQDAIEFPVPPAGTIDRTWLSGKMVATATLDGRYVDVGASDTIAALRPDFLRLALSLGFDDFDAAALKSAYPRDLTQQIVSVLYSQIDPDGRPVADGVRFASRHGDELRMWAIFERPGDEPSSQRLSEITVNLVDVEGRELAKAMTLHKLTWRR